MNTAEFPTLTKIFPPGIMARCAICGEYRRLRYRDYELVGDGICTDCLGPVCAVDRALQAMNFRRPGQHAR